MSVVSNDSVTFSPSMMLHSFGGREEIDEESYPFPPAPPLPCLLSKKVQLSTNDNDSFLCRIFCTNRVLGTSDIIYLCYFVGNPSSAFIPTGAAAGGFFFFLGGGGLFHLSGCPSPPPSAGGEREEDQLFLSRIKGWMAWGREKKRKERERRSLLPSSLLFSVLCSLQRPVTTDRPPQTP